MTAKLDLERLLEHITAAAEYQRFSPTDPSAFERYLARTLRGHEAAGGLQVRLAREAIETMREPVRERAA